MVYGEVIQLVMLCELSGNPIVDRTVHGNSFRGWRCCMIFRATQSRQGSACHFLMEGVVCFCIFGIPENICLMFLHSYPL